MNQLQLAQYFATVYHKNQVDIGGTPYIEHPRAVANRLPQDPQLQTLAWLHDLIEDTPLTLDQVSQYPFDAEVLQGLQVITRIDQESYDAYLSRVMTSRLATLVKIEDLHENSRLSRLNREPKARDWKRLVKYQTAIAQLTQHAIQSGWLTEAI